MGDLEPIDDRDLFGIAIIGMAGRFPGARNVDEFWRNLQAGVESIRPFTPDELAAAGIDKETLAKPSFVNAGAVMPEADAFDAPFFGITSREAEIMDPQHRVLLETAWEALEDAGYDAEIYQGAIGIYAGVGPNTYFQKNLATQPELLQLLGRYAVLMASEKEYAVTRVSYKLNLTGPSVSVNTACSTSGVAIHMACQSLLNEECDMALAGGGRIGVPLTGGYVYEEGGIPSPDGHCRAFDAQGRGTVSGSGVALVVLKRLADAIRDSDCIHAVIKGSAVNNDGAQKVGFTAPSIQGQARVISEALGVADIDPESIGYVEAHGTGTSLGDPIEIAALTEAYRKWTDKKGWCPIGSVKTNIGHLDAGAGVAGAIKAVLALEHQQIPPSLNFERPNPQIDFANSPFYVNTELSSWLAGPTLSATPRRAAVSSFGLGGTNAHIILEEAPRIEASRPGRTHQLLLLSARTDAALTRATQNLADHLSRHPGVNLADVAYTLQTGRRAFEKRRMLVCRDAGEALSALDSVDTVEALPATALPATPLPLAPAEDREVVFMFSGQGSQYANMCRELYEDEPMFRQEVDRCAGILAPLLSRDLREILFPDNAHLEEAELTLQQTAFTQPALFVVEYALARLWLSWGIRPAAMIGHSIGEYVAACLASVFSLDDALSLVAARGRLMQELPGGAMLAVPLSPQELRPLLDGQLDLAVVNAPSLCVASGERQAIEALEQALAEKGITCRPLHTSHAFHSRMMEPIVEAFRARFKGIRLGSPNIPFVSNVSGTWISAEQATNPDYWAAHLRQTVRFSDGLAELLEERHRILLEVGPGRTLEMLAKQHPANDRKHLVLGSTRHPKEQRSDQAFILNALGQLWLAGMTIDWTAFHAGERRCRVPLPTYPFERRRYWIDPAQLQFTAPAMAPGSAARDAGSPRGLPPGGESSMREGATYGSREDAKTRRPGGAGGTRLEALEGAPRNEVERSLAGLWRGLLGVDRLSIHDNFFDLGGSSLLATRLFTQVAEVFGKKLPLATIFEAPTIAQLSRLLDQGPFQAAHTSLIKMRDGRSAFPLYYVPGNMGNIFIDLKHLARHLNSDRPLYAFQDGIGHPSRIEALAAHFIRDIRTIQPEGPYLLAGSCLGAAVAFEMAQQLRRKGERVALLALVEPAPLSLPGSNSYRDLARDLGTRFGRRFTRQSGAAAQHDRDDRRSTPGSLNELVSLGRFKLKVLANIWELRRYHPQPYPDGYDLFLTKESLQSTRYGWRKMSLGEVEVHEIPGTHRTVVGDHVPVDEESWRVVGSELGARIDACRL